MGISVEATIAIVGLFTTLPPTLLVLWNCILGCHQMTHRPGQLLRNWEELFGSNGRKQLMMPSYKSNIMPIPPYSTGNENVTKNDPANECRHMAADNYIWLFVEDNPTPGKIGGFIARPSRWYGAGATTRLETKSSNCIGCSIGGRAGSNRYCSVVILL
jgi:hypothetical protein